MITALEAVLFLSKNEHVPLSTTVTQSKKKKPFLFRLLERSI
jgi:hypothetical protein